MGTFVGMAEIISAAIIHNDAKTQAQTTDLLAEQIAIRVKYGFRDVAKNRLGQLLERPSLNRQIREILKARLTGIARRLIFWKRNEKPQYVQFPSDRFTKGSDL